MTNSSIYARIVANNYYDENLTITGILMDIFLYFLLGSIFIVSFLNVIFTFFIGVFIVRSYKKNYDYEIKNNKNISLNEKKEIPWDKKYEE